MEDFFLGVIYYVVGGLALSASESSHSLPEPTFSESIPNGTRFRTLSGSSFVSSLTTEPDTTAYILASFPGPVAVLASFDLDAFETTYSSSSSDSDAHGAVFFQTIAITGFKGCLFVHITSQVKKKEELNDFSRYSFSYRWISSG